MARWVGDVACGDWVESFIHEGYWIVILIRIRLIYCDSLIIISSFVKSMQFLFLAIYETDYSNSMCLENAKSDRPCCK